jgi:hypothetical protein
MQCTHVIRISTDISFITIANYIQWSLKATGIFDFLDIISQRIYNILHTFHNILKNEMIRTYLYT